MLSLLSFPIYAQQNLLTPREANGKLVCANCHLNPYPISISSLHRLLPNEIFDLKLSVQRPQKDLFQNSTLNGVKKILGIGGIIVLPENFEVAYEKTEGDQFIAYSTEEDQTIVIGPLYSNTTELKVPLKSPAPENQSAPTTYLISAGLNRGRGQLTPTGEKTDTNVADSDTINIKFDNFWRSSKGHLYVSTNINNALARFDGNLQYKFPSSITTQSVDLFTSVNNGGFGQNEFSLSVLNPADILYYFVFAASCLLAQFSLVWYKKDYLSRRRLDKWISWWNFILRRMDKQNSVFFNNLNPNHANKKMVKLWL